MNIVRKYIAPLLLAVILLLAVRGLLLTHMRLPAETAPLGLKAGSHVLVSRTSYGLRLPGEALWGYHRWGYRQPALDEALVYTRTDPAPGGRTLTRTIAGICRALPGDTVWTDPVRRLILPGRTSPDAVPFIIPGRGKAIRVTPANAVLLTRIMRRYEGSRAKVDQHGRIWLRKDTLTCLSTARDYYWIETAPDSYDLVPQDALVGKIIPLRLRPHSQ